MKKILSEITIVVVLIVVGTVQGFAHRNFYNRIEFGAGNAWTFVLMEGLSMTLNQITDKPLSEATYNTAAKSNRFGTQDKPNKNVIRTWATTQEKSIQRISRPK